METIERLPGYCHCGCWEHVLARPASQRRRRPRFEVNRPAKLRFGGQSVLARILDLSTSGARLRCATSDWMPSILEVEDTRGQRYRALLVWQGEGEIGVRWVNEAPDIKPPPTFGRRAKIP
jgi:hypothetical protein